VNPGFSERTFEFCFNAEFCQMLGGILASHPHIPSQQMEKDLGYDVEFKIKQGQFTGSIFIQHKVSSYAEVRAGRNAEFYNTHNGPYFRFSLDNEQHNTLCALCRTKGNAFYCAPMFHLSHELEAHFRAQTISSNSLLLDPLQVGEIKDNNRHNITYGPNGDMPTLHSKIRRFEKSFRANNKEELPIKRKQISTEYLSELSEELIDRTLESKFRESVTDKVYRMRPIQRAQFILGRVYHVSWILVP